MSRKIGRECERFCGYQPSAARQKAAFCLAGCCEVLADAEIVRQINRLPVSIIEIRILCRGGISKKEFPSGIEKVGAFRNDLAYGNVFCLPNVAEEAAAFVMLLGIAGIQREAANVTASNFDVLFMGSLLLK